MVGELMMNFIDKLDSLLNSREALVAASSEAMVAELEAAYKNKKNNMYQDAAGERLDAAMKAITQTAAGAAGGASASSSRKQRKSRKSRKMRR